MESGIQRKAVGRYNNNDSLIEKIKCKLFVKYQRIPFTNRGKYAIMFKLNETAMNIPP